MYYDKNEIIKPDIAGYYKEISGLKLPIQVYFPQNFNSTKKYKTMIVIHGGGWYSLKETPKQWNGGRMVHNARYYAKQGWVGIVFSYRDINFSDKIEVGDLIEDCNDALQYIKDNFEFVDKDNIAMMGDSAGGHLVCALSMGLTLKNGAALKPKMTIAYNPVTDCIHPTWRYCANSDEKRIEASLIHSAVKSDSIFLIMHGQNDTDVDIEDSRRFYRIMKELGNNCTMIELPDAVHAFIVFDYHTDDEDVLKAYAVTDEFIQKYGL